MRNKFLQLILISLDSASWELHQYSRRMCGPMKNHKVDFVYTLASANTDQSVPNLATISIPIKSGMSSIMGQIESEHPELFALEFGKIAETDLVCTLASTNINQSAPNLCDHKILDEFDYGFNQTRTV